MQHCCPTCQELHEKLSRSVRYSQRPPFAEAKAGQIGRWITRLENSSGLQQVSKMTSPSKALPIASSLGTMTTPDKG